MFFGLITWIRIIYKVYFLMHLFTDSLYYTKFFEVMTCDRFQILQKFLPFNGNANCSYDPNDGNRNCCHQVFPFNNMKLGRKLYYPKKKVNLGKSLVLNVPRQMA